jgi:acyl carrier protein
MNDLEREISGIVIDALNLEMTIDEINPRAPLHGDQGLGLDSIDLLELSVLLSKRYGFQIKSDDPRITEIFASLSALARTVESCRTK